MTNKTRISWARPEIDSKELGQIENSFKADWLTMGPKVKEFESIMANYLNVPYAVAVTNGSIALDIALKILNVGPEDEVIVPAMTYIATAFAVSYQRATPVFVDIEPDSYNLDPLCVEEAISSKTKGIIYIDYGGNPADYDRLQAVAEKHNLFLLQDAAQSLGAKYHNNPVGAQTEISTMSFHMAKIMTTVEGGMIFTHNEEFANIAKIIRNQGESGKYLHSHIGTNARMTDIAAGIGLAQFKKLPWMLEERKRVAKRYNSFFKDEPNIEIMECKQPDSEHAFFFYPILVDNRDELATYLKNIGIDTRIAYPMPIYKQEVYKKQRLVCKNLACPVAEKFTEKVLNLPIFPSMKNEQVDIVAREILKKVTQ